MKRDAFGVPSILFFVLSAQAPLTSIVGAACLAIAMGNGAGAPGAYLAVGLVVILFSVGFTTITRHLDTRGGFFAVIRAGLGLRSGAGGSLLALLSYNAVQFAMYGLFGASMAGLIGRTAGFSSPWWVWSLAAIALVWFLGSRKVELGARVLAVLVAFELLLLIAFGIGVLATRGLSSLDVAGSFSPTAVLAGAPGVAIMFAIASMFGFESTAIYAGEAKDPKRTIPRATYIAVTLIAVFLALVTWMLVAYYGAAQVQDQATQVLGSDPALFALTPLESVLGGWASTAADVLLCTSLFAGVLAFHNMITRYFHAMAGSCLFPAILERTNRHQAPANASAAQSFAACAAIAPFAILGLDPVAKLFSWFSGLAVATLIVLYTLTSVAVIAYFRRHPVETGRWATLIAPGLSTVLMLGILALVLNNFGVLTGGDATTVVLLLITIPVSFALGWSRVRGGTRAPATAEVADLA
ncbi:APC family permease [Amycolatopsis sp. NPDC098790]|uniref:APC family permease n=1 Tax=Amycolatopsis sp. NPDC098790 TaxID=3363939 RepID=UPI00381FD2B8